MATKSGTMFGPTLREMAVLECRMPGQGLKQGEKYLLVSMEYEASGSDMLSTYGTVYGMRGDVFEIKNMHIAFDLEDFFEREGI